MTVNLRLREMCIQARLGLFAVFNYFSITIIFKFVHVIYEKFSFFRDKTPADLSDPIIRATVTFVTPIILDKNSIVYSLGRVYLPSFAGILN